MLPGLAGYKNEHHSLQDLQYIQNSIPEIECFGMKRREQHAWGIA